MFHQTIMHGADAMRSRELMLVVREAQAIIIFDALARTLRRIHGVGIIISKTRGAISVHVHRRFAFDDPLRHQLAHAARAAVAIQRHARHHPKSARAWHGSEQRLAIGRVRAGMTHQRNNARLIQKRQAANRAFEQHFKLIEIAGKTFTAMFPRRAVNPTRNWVGFIAANHKSALLLAHVHQIIGVAQTRRIVRELMSGHSLQRDMLMIHRSRRDLDSHHRGDTRRPHPCRVDDDLASDLALVCHHSFDISLRRKFDPRHARVRINGRAQIFGKLRH